MRELIARLSSFLTPYIENVQDSYNWPIPDNLPLNLSIDRNTSNYQQNVDLKLSLSRLWSSSSIEHKCFIAEWIVKEWGRITKGMQSLPDMVNRIENGTFDCPYARVASYSKILAVKNPFTFAIYDARVSVSLNAVQILEDLDCGIAFNMPPGRNKLTGFTGKGVGFSEQTIFKPKYTTTNRGWAKVKRAVTYKLYLQTLQDIRARIKGSELYDIEMALFSIAPELASLAMEKYGLLKPQDGR
jgi:hypothetical protein